MAKPNEDRELTSTLHLGLRSIVGNSPADIVRDFLKEATSEESEIIKGLQSGDGNSAMVFIHRGPKKGARFLVTAEGVTIGRSHESAIFLDDVTVSRKHASIEKSGESFTFQDSGSLNGSYVNNESVTSKDLVSGDEIQIGKFHLLFIGRHLTGEK